MTTGGAPPAPGTSVTSGGVGVHVHSHSLAAVVVAGMFMAAAIEDSREPRGFPSFSSFADWFRGTPAPQLAADRPISEHDCSKPLPEITGNLKCR